VKKLFVPSCILFATLVPCSADVINFDDQATAGGAVSLSSQYLSSGVLFQNIYAAQNFKSNIFPPSVPNYASPFWVDLNPGLIIFVAPGNPGINTTVSGVSFTLVGLTTPPAGFYSGATIDALDLSGNVIAGQSVTIPGTSTPTANQILTFTGPIHELRFTHTVGTSGAFPIDDLVFAPEPSSFGLLGVGVGLLSAFLLKCGRA